tara:strand:+ start:529 stop:1887 length:1359 start_codon:yes stop_codon:yes gene_type:complete
VKQKNILIIILDSIRADKFFGKNKASKIPNIEKLIEKGVYFENTTSPSDGTLLGWAGIFTGQYPFRTGITIGGFSKINKNIPTIFDLLKEEYNFYGHLPEVASKIGLFPKFENKNVFFNKYTNFEDGLGEEIISEFSNLKSPWCYILHSYDMHFPIKLAEKFDQEKYGKTKYDRVMASIDHWLGRILDSVNLDETLLIITADHGTHINELLIDDESLDIEKDQMLNSVAPKIGKIIPEKLLPLKSKVFFALEKKRKKQKEKNISNLNLEPHEVRQVMFQRGDLDKFLYDENVHVPLLFVDSELPKNIKINKLARAIDISPTILDLINSDHKFEKSDGSSLMQEIHGDTVDEKFGFIENTPLIQKKANLVIGIRTKKYKYFRDSEDPSQRVYLFDLEIDEFEENNIADSRPDIVEKMEKYISKINYKISSDSIIPDKKETKIIKNELKKLGYD